MAIPNQLQKSIITLHCVKHVPHDANSINHPFRLPHHPRRGGIPHNFVHQQVSYDLLSLFIFSLTEWPVLP